MLKLSKIHVSLVSTLGLMVATQLGLGIYNGFQPRSDERGAKAFGLAVPQEKHFQVGSVKELDRVFSNSDYTLNKASHKREVPRLYLAKLPKDMKNKAKSSNGTFIQVLLPHILKVNEKILTDRKRLVDLKEQLKTRHLRHTEKMWLMKLASDYRCKSTKIDALLMHVDIIPPSLALAQATLETGGGRSPAALSKNSTFGHMTRNNKVMKFDSLQQNVEAYVHNLNRHFAYASFRKVRAELRAKNKPLCGIKLAACLDKYSIRKAAYIQDVQGLIHKRGLDKYDVVTLEQVHLKP
ncbi:MAG: glucosaminidase domain-containing protein [Alphaproteobacteria bacterium]|nr:glucosaminidase domain-containing protein [Alphaproteobacteria bacterium]